MNKLYPSRRQGFTMTEMMMCLIIMSGFMVLASKTFWVTFSTTRGAGELMNVESSFAAAVRQLRVDVWGASDLRSTAAGELTVVLPDKTEITWRVRDAGLSRQGNTTQHWQGLGRIPMELAVDGPEVVVRLKKLPQADEVRLSSLLLQQRRSS